MCYSYVSLQVVIFHTLQTSLRPQPFSRRCDITMEGKSSLPDVGTRRRCRSYGDDGVQPQRQFNYTLLLYILKVDARNTTAHANGTERDGIIKTGLVFFFSSFIFIFNSLFPIGNTHAHGYTHLHSHTRTPKIRRTGEHLFYPTSGARSLTVPLSLASSHSFSLTSVFSRTHDLNVSPTVFVSQMPSGLYYTTPHERRSNRHRRRRTVRYNNNYPVYFTGVGICTSI